MRKMIRKMEAAALALSLLAGAGSLCAGPGAPVTAYAKAKVKAKKLTLKAPVKTLYIGGPASKKSTKLKVTIKPKKASQKVKYKTSSKKILTVSNAGKVTAKKTGKATVTVTSQSNKKLKKKITFRVRKYTDKTSVTPAPEPEPTVSPKDTALTSLSFSTEKKTVNLGSDEGRRTTQLSLNKVPENATEPITYKSSDESVATVDENGILKAKTMGRTTVTAVSGTGKEASCLITVVRSKVEIHDPSVYRDPVSGKYYSLGSNVTAAESDDLVGWTLTVGGYAASEKLFSKPYQQEFAEAYAYTMPDGAEENCWAPDIIYNKTMKKYCMYASIVDGSKKCCIAMAVSDKPDGPYSYRGMIVCSGLNSDGSDVDKTNIAAALGLSDAEAKASKYATLGNNSPDCIDPTVFYDHKDNLWMVYGSFTTAGGIRLLKLDTATGLRGANYADSGDGSEATLGTDDPYYGKKIANNNGEGPYIQEVKDSKSPTGYYYYLWTSVGGLQSYGGYNMRLVRATDVEGPYEDPNGNAATSSLGRAELGLRVMDNYKFSFMDVAFTSCGGNSAETSADGKTFIHFHQKYANGSEGFNIRTHQTFVNEDGWLVTAPFEYNGETIADSYEKSKVAGSYEFIYHRTSYTRTDTVNYDYVSSERLDLKEDGTVSGAYSGTWSLNGHDITIDINGQTYKGVVLEQSEQTDAREKVMVFTAVGTDNRTIWGSRMHKSDEEAVQADLSRISVPGNADSDFTLPEEGLFGSAITWTSQNEAVISINGNKAVVTRPDADTAVTLTASLKKGTASASKEYTVQVKAYEMILPGSIQEATTLSLIATTPMGTAVTWTSSDPDIIDAATGAVTVGSSLHEVTLTAVYGTITKEFKIRVGKLDLTSIFKQDYEASDLTTAEAGWTCHTALTNTIESEEGNHFIKCVSTGTGARAGLQDFGIAADQLTDSYAVNTDFLVETATYTGSGIPTTQIALISDANTMTGTTTSLSEDECIIDLRAEGLLQRTFTVNGNQEETVTLPTDEWCHMEVTVDRTGKQAFLVITKKESGEELYSGSVPVAGSANVKGIYILNGRGGTITQFDNTDVSVTKS